MEMMVMEDGGGWASFKLLKERSEASPPKGERRRPKTLPPAD